MYFLLLSFTGFVAFPVAVGFPEETVGESGKHLCSGAASRRLSEAQTQWHGYCARNVLYFFSWFLSKHRLSLWSFLICKYFH